MLAIPHMGSSYHLLKVSKGSRYHCRYATIIIVTCDKYRLIKDSYFYIVRYKCRPLLYWGRPISSNALRKADRDWEGTRCILFFKCFNLFQMCGVNCFYKSFYKNTLLKMSVSLNLWSTLSGYYLHFYLCIKTTMYRKGT